jgi:hypothetical protein
MIWMFWIWARVQRRPRPRLAGHGHGFARVWRMPKEQETPDFPAQRTCHTAEGSYSGCHLSQAREWMVGYCPDGASHGQSRNQTGRNPSFPHVVAFVSAISSSLRNICIQAIYNASPQHPSRRPINEHSPSLHRGVPAAVRDVTLRTPPSRA